MHQTALNVLRVLLNTNPPRTVANAADLIDQAIATAMHSMKVNVNNALKVSPRSLVFGRNIILDIPSFFLSFGPASKVPKLTNYGVV